MQRSGRPRAPRSRATLRPQRFTRAPTSYVSRGRGRIQKQPSRAHIDDRTPKRNRDAYINHDVRDVQQKPPLPGLEATPRAPHRKDSIHACSEASLEFISLSGLETDEDTNTIALNLMDYFLFSPDNWLPEFSYCKLHAACFLFASRITGQSNTVDQVADSLGPDSAFVQLVGSPLAEDEESAVAVQYTISVTVFDVEDGYKLLYRRKEMFGHLLGPYVVELEQMPAPNVDQQFDALIEKDDSENWDIFDGDE